jgi:uncharacterized protein
MAKDLGVPVAEMSTDPARLERVDLERYRTEEVGLPTLRDILEELKKPGRDPREHFQTATFRDDVKEIADLQEGIVVRVGEVVKVKVLSVDAARKRIGLSIKEAAGEGGSKGKPSGRKEAPKARISDAAAWEKAGFRVKKR